MKKIQLITSNSNKADEYNRYARDLGFSTIFEIRNIEVPEIQNEDLNLVLLRKVEYISGLTSLPFLIEDTIFLTEKYNSFPGTNVKFINRSLGIDGWKKLFQEGDRISAITRIGFSHLENKHFFEGKLDGIISFKNDGEVDPNAPLNSIFYIPERKAFLGDLVKLSDFENHRKKAFHSFFLFLEDEKNKEGAIEQEAQEKWDSRAKTWHDVLENQSSVVNFENGYERFLSLLKKFTPLINGRVLDIGTGIGTVAEIIAQNTAGEVLGIDTSGDMIIQAQENNKFKNLTFSQKDIEAVSVGEKFDFLVTRGVLISQLPVGRVVDFLEKITEIASDGCYFMFDFVQNKKDGDFSAENVMEFTGDCLERVLRELGWIKVYREDNTTNRIGILIFHKPAPDGIYFATSNPIKIAELQNALVGSKKKIYFYGIEIDEIKSDSLEKIVAEKLKRSYEAIGHPVLCTDGGIFIEALKGFPGENSKQAAQKLGAAGILKLLENVTVRKAIRRNCMGYFDGTEMKNRIAEIECEISQEIREKYPAYELDKILIPDRSENSQRLTYSEIPLEYRIVMTELPQLAQFVETLS
jgi:XTP/dITP diphosphohydrolase